MRKSINIAPFFAFAVVIQTVATAKAEIKKRGLYELPLNQHYYPIYPYHGYDLLSELNNLVWLSPNFYHDFHHLPYHHHHHHQGLVFDHLESPWQIINLANINPASIKIPIFPPVSLPRAKLPEPAPAQPSPPQPQQDHSVLRNSQIQSFQPPTSQQTTFSNPNPPPTASHPQIGTGRLGSGSLGYVVLPNGRVALGSGSLGYTPAVTSTPAPIANDQAQQFRGTQGSRGNEAFGTIINSFSNGQREKPFNDFLSFLSGEQLSGPFTSGRVQRPMENRPKEIFGDFIPIVNKNDHLHSLEQRQRPNETPSNNFVPELNERHIPRPFINGHGLKENLQGYSSEFDGSQNAASYNSRF